MAEQTGLFFLVKEWGGGEDSTFNGRPNQANREGGEDSGAKPPEDKEVIFPGELTHSLSQDLPAFTCVVTFSTRQAGTFSTFSCVRAQ